ncbi:MAG: RNA-binding protein [Dehalococcoidia bacterium]|nr:MAG: RNA-binding protein [Dehalococcoidia bacterium]
MTQQTVDSTPQKIHVGNLAAQASEADVRALFAVHGNVASYNRPTEGDAQQPSGFAFVEMTKDDAAKAIKALDGHELAGQAIKVSAARATA